jgi:putative membrane protein
VLVRRAVLVVLGALALTVLWLGPLPALARQAFAAHMTMHMGVVAVAAPLVALGIAGARFDPVRRRPAWFAPIPLSVVELLVVWGWHAPALHELARRTPAGLVLEQGTFFVAGLLVWLSAFGGEPGDRDRRAAGLVALLLTSMHMTLLGALLALPPRPLYPHVAGVAAWSRLHDQQLGGAIMLVAGSVAYLAGGLWLTAGLLRGTGARREERA